MGNVHVFSEFATQTVDVADWATVVKVVLDDPESAWSCLAT